MISVSSLPAVNATLNATAGVLLLAGYFFIRRKKVAVHRIFMLLAFLTSALFLASYVYYHAHAGSVPYAGRGWRRPVYFTILISHISLAAAILPLAITTLARALRRDFDRHRRLARFTLPIWIYVSVTGVVIYMMLYG